MRYFRVRPKREQRMTPDERQGPGHTFLSSRDSAAGREG